MINIGIIGCGSIAQMRHIPEYRANPYTHLLGFFDQSEERTKQVASANNGKAYDSWQALVEDHEIDAVSVCTANASHAEIAIAALDAGKHVLLEKPMAGTIEQCERVVEAANKTGKLLMLDHNQRFDRAHIMARDLLRNGAIGDMLSFQTSFRHGGPELWSIDPGPGTWFFDTMQTTMGVVGDLGIHKTDLLHFLTGQRIVEVAAKLATLEKKDATGKPIPLDDNAFAIYTMTGGAVGTMTASWSHHGTEDNSTVLYGKKGIITIYGHPDCALLITRPGATREEFSTGAEQANSGAIDAFVDAIRLGLPSPVSGDEALAAMRAVFAAQQSSREGRSVAIPENAATTSQLAVNWAGSMG